MFNLESIAVCNYFSPSKGTLAAVDKTKHPSLQRLLEVAAKHGVSSHSALAAALTESEQVITNWAKRGVSAIGAIKAQKVFGCSPLWILEGIGASGPNGYSPEALALGWTLDQIADKLVKKRAETEASAILLAAIQQLELRPTDRQERQTAPSRLS